MSAAAKKFPSPVWGGADPLPPSLAHGWTYVVSPDDWLLVRSPSGVLFFVACDDGEYSLFPRCVARGDDEEILAGVKVPAGHVYLDERSPRPLPVAGGVRC